jgi:hypothetical protein
MDMADLTSSGIMAGTVERNAFRSPNAQAGDSQALAVAERRGLGALAVANTADATVAAAKTISNQVSGEGILSRAKGLVSGKGTMIDIMV